MKKLAWPKARKEAEASSVSLFSTEIGISLLGPLSRAELEHVDCGKRMTQELKQFI